MAYTPAANNAAFENFEKNSPSAFPKLEETPTSSRRCCGPKCLALTLLIGGCFLAVLGIVYGTAMPAYVNSAVEDEVVSCTAEDVAKESYLDPYGDCDSCSPYYVSVYMLNASNAESYLDGSASKLQVQEMGPYVYRRRSIKLDVSLSDDSARVTYKTYTYHTFVEEKSCDGCSDSDEVVSIDTGYMSVVAATGGEFNLLAAVAAGSFGADYNTTELVALVTEYGEQMMRWMNGLNSLDPLAMKTVTNNSAVLTFLATGPEAIADLDLTGFAYNGIFVRRTVSQWALGYPSLLAGLILGSNYVSVCEAGMNDECAACEGDDCTAIASDCSQCTSGAAVVAANNVTCAKVEAIYAAEYGDEEAASFVSTTCGLCSSVGLCAMPLPGIAESSGMDYSETAPDADSLGAYVKRTGCDDLDAIGDYEEYDGYTTAAVWVDLGERRNPTLAELNGFSSYADCDNSPASNVTCFAVSGTDGTSIRPGGVSVTGLAKETSVDSFESYLGPAEISISIESTGDEVDFSGVTLHRFSTPVDIFVYSDAKASVGTGFPVDGVQQLSFVTGFLSYLSGPYFIYGDESLLDAVEMTTADGTVMTYDTMYDDNGDLLEDYSSAYVTFVDVEAGTGQTMSARKRTQVNYALSASTAVTNASMSDMLFPTLPTEVILPTYWAQEAGEATDDLLDTFKSTVTLTKTFLPILIVLLVVGVAVVGGGVFLWRRYKQKQQMMQDQIII